MILSEPKEIQNFDEITVNSVTNEYFYQFLEPHLIEDRDPYFYFGFLDDVLSYSSTIRIIDENQNEGENYCKRPYNFIGFNITNLNPQKYKFYIINSYYYSRKMLFIDSSRDININIEKLFTIKFSTNSIQNRPPMPLIFNIKSIKDKTIFSVDPYSDTDIYDGDYILEFWEISENSSCEFTGSNLLVLKKGKKYKFQFNCYHNSYSSFRFNAFEINYAIKEIGFGPMFFEITESARYLYFIIDIKKYNNIYLYADFNDKFRIAFI